METTTIRIPRDGFEACLFETAIAAAAAKWSDAASYHVGDPDDAGRYSLTVTKRVPFNPRRYFDAPSIEGAIWIEDRHGEAVVVFSAKGITADARDIDPSALLN
jgi:hypothetical protein